MRQELAYLRNTWDWWKYDPGASSIRYSSEAYEKEFERLAEVATDKQTKAAKLADEVHAREATHPGPKL